MPARCEHAERPGRFCAIYALWGEAVVKGGVVSFGGHLCNAVMLGETEEPASTQHATGHDISGAIHIAHLTSLTHADVPPYPPVRLGVHKRAHIHTHTYTGVYIALLSCSEGGKAALSVKSKHCCSANTAVER